MMPKRTAVQRSRGQWVATVPGYGLLPVVHSELSDFKARRYRCVFDPAGEPRKTSAHLQAFEDNPGFVLVQRDLPRETPAEAYQADGYLGVFAIKDMAFDAEAGALSFTYVGREPVRLG